MIFISHSSVDDDFVNQLVTFLQLKEIATWVDHIDVPIGVHWRNHLDEVLSQAHAMILIVSQDALNSIWVEAEWQTMLRLRRPILPIILDGSRLPPVLELFQSVRFNPHGDLRALVNRIVRDLPQTAQADDTRPPRPVDLTSDFPRMTRDIASDSELAQLMLRLVAFRRKARELLQDQAGTMRQGQMALIFPTINDVMVTLLTRPLIIGRGQGVEYRPDIDLSRFDSESTVSRRHAMLSITRHGPYLMDLYSHNGTFVDQRALANGVPTGHERKPLFRLEPKNVYAIKSEAILRFGRCVLMLHYQP